MLFTFKKSLIIHEENTKEMNVCKSVCKSMFVNRIKICPDLHKAYSGAVNRLKSLWDNAILGDLRKNWDFQALRFNAILGDLRRFKKKP